MSTAIYVYIGLDEARRNTLPQDWPKSDDGFMGVVDDCDRAAALVDAYWNQRRAADPNFEYPGVWDYEVTEHMGHWLYSAGMRWTDSEFNAEIARFVKAEINSCNDRVKPDPFTYEVRPCTEVDNCVTGCEPSEAMYWGVYERGGNSPAVWAADFARQADAQVFADAMAASHI